MKKLLLHICCAPCGAGCVEHPFLTDPAKGVRREVMLYFSNSNLNSRSEYEKRLHYVKILADMFSLPLEADPYDHDSYLAFVAGLEDAPEHGARCGRCFEFSLSRTALRAQQCGYAFATTLTVSPHKSSRTIFEVGSKWEHFEALDFKKCDGYRKGTLLAKAHGFYRQNYCGCEFSLRDMEERQKAAISALP